MSALPITSPDTLRLRFARRWPGALEELYDRYAARMHAAAMRLLRDREAAADAVQDAFVRAWRAADQYDPHRPLEPWLFAVLRRAVVDVQRSGWRHDRRVERARTVADADSPSAGFERAWEAWEVRKAVDSLPVDERAVLRLAYFERLTFGEIATRLGVPVGTVKSRSHRAHNRLTAALRHLAVEEPG